MELVTGDLKQIKTLTTLLLDSKSIRKKSCTKTNSMHPLLQAVFVFKCTLKDEKVNYFSGLGQHVCEMASM